MVKMENFPVELLTSIFVKLHKLQKIECMSVCRRWNEVIKSRCLLETVVTRSTSCYIRPFHSLMTHIRNNHFSGLCTRCLVLGNLEGLNVNIAELSTLFPNLRSLILKESNFQMYWPLTSEETIPILAKWLSQLEYIYEYNESPVIPSLINHPYRFDQLVSLSVSGYTNITFGTSTTWFKHLKNTPSLKILKVRNFYTELDDIEALHKNAPLITTVELDNIAFLTTESLDSRLPEPPLIEILSMEYYPGSFSSLEPWVFYSLKNYIHIHDFKFEYDDPNFQDELPEEPALNIIMALGDCIQSFRTNLKIQGYHELEELNRKNLRLNDLQFSIDLFGDVHFNGDELIRRCDMFKSLHRLEIFDFNPEIFEMTKEFTNLKHLTLQFPYSRHTFKTSTISLNAILLHQCPNQLESLLNFGHIDDAAFEFLSKQCPNLLQLVLYGATFSPSSINLPSHDMDLLEIIGLFSANRDVRVIQDGDVRLYPKGPYHGMFYYPEKDDFTLYSGIKPYQPRDVDKIRFLDLTFRSIRTVILNGNVIV